MTLPRKRRPIPLFFRVLIGVTAGCILGAWAGTGAILGSLTTRDLGQLGLLVIKLLRTLAAPLILFAILDSFARTRITAKNGVRLLVICLVNVSVAMVIGLTIMNLFKPGERWKGHMAEFARVLHPPGLERKKSEDPEAPEMSIDLVKNIAYYVPSSIVKPFIYNNVITIVLFGVLAGAAMRSVKTKQELAGQTGIATLERLIESIYHVLVQMLEWVVQAVPFAVFGVVAQVVGATGSRVFGILWVFLATTLAGLAIHSLIYYPLVAWWYGRKTPREYIGIGADAILTGLSTNSSLATVPLTLAALKRMKVSDRSARLAACIGTNLNNDGITLYEAMTALFLAQAVGMHLGLGQQMIVVAASIMAGAGIAGVPEAGLIVLPLVLSAAGLPVGMVEAAIPLIIPVDWIIARCRSGVNVMSDMLVAIILDRFDPDEHAMESQPPIPSV